MCSEEIVSLKGNNLAFENFINAFTVDEKIKNFNEESFLSSISGSNDYILSSPVEKHFVGRRNTSNSNNSNQRIVTNWVESICTPTLDPRGNRQFQSPSLCLS